MTPYIEMWIQQTISKATSQNNSHTIFYGNIDGKEKNWRNTFFLHSDATSFCILKPNMQELSYLSRVIEEEAPSAVCIFGISLWQAALANKSSLLVSQTLWVKHQMRQRHENSYLLELYRHLGYISIYCQVGASVPLLAREAEYIKNIQ